jgi:two-component system, LytTR family, sensor kinase
MSKSFFRNNIITILAHICAWAAFLMVPFFLDEQPITSPPITNNDVPIEGKTVVAILIIAVFYINYLVLVPRILNKKGTRPYLVSVLFLALTFIGIMVIVVKNINGIPPQLSPFVFIFPFTIILALSLALRLLKDRNHIEQERKERENETLKSELSFLRSQISPHFLFNIMNNVVALSRVKPEKVEPTLIQLSHLMRYMLYNSDEKKVSITKEIEYLESYIDLQKLRFGDSVNVVFNKNLENVIASDSVATEGGQLQQIEPMLLIPFVENAFKHGTGLIENPKIEINLSVTDKQLIFNVLNKYDPHNIETKDKDSGIGLKNVSRRLDLLYGENQKMSINTEGGVFQVDLAISFISKIK